VSDAVLLVEIDLRTADSLIFDGGGSTVRGMVVNRGANGLWFRNGTGYVVEGCYIGTDPAGMVPRTNAVGIRLDTSGNRIGGLGTAQRNLISGNITGILLPCPVNGSCAADTLVVNSYIGTSTQFTALPNAYGIDGTNTSGLVIGGTAIGAENVISGNAAEGIRLKGHGPVHNSAIVGNRIGAGAVGQVVQPLPNGGSGVRLEMFCSGPPCGDPVFVVSRNYIANNLHGVWIDGGTIAVSENYVGANTWNGIYVSAPLLARGTVTDNSIYNNGSAGLLVDGGALSVTGNVVNQNGLDDGSAGIVVRGSADAVALSGNRLWANAGLGIDLLGDGVTLNDPGDGDVGPNALQNFPVLTSACLGGGYVSVTGGLASLPSSTYALEFFLSTACDPSGHGEAEYLIGSASATTANDGSAAFLFSRPSVFGPGFITATASAPSGTSELSACLPLSAPIPPPAQTISGPTSVCAGTPFALGTTGGGDTYQWMLNGAPIVGATAATYGRSSAAPADAGSYTVTAYRCGSPLTSPPRSLSVVTCAALPVRLDVDSHAGAGTTSDLNRVLEAGESVLVEPRYQNTTAAAMALTGSATLIGPAPGGYALPDASASYGTVGAGQVTDCFGATGDCYRATVSGPRPQTHWDATFVETVTGGGVPARYWPLHIGETFADVPRANPFYRFVETLVHNAVTSGCSTTDYCPTTPTNRQQMAVFVLVAREGVTYAPPACNPAAPRFTDVPASSPFCRWIEELARRAVVSGCGPNLYCPLTNVPRNQMAVFVLATREAPGYLPPSCVAGSERFPDVPASSGFCRWIEELARRNVVSGCGNGNYCPSSPVSRGEMSVFIVATFGLLLYGP
jgi:hypothetical protein